MNHKKLNRQITLGIMIGLVLGLLFALEIIGTTVFGINLVEIARFFGKIFMQLLKMIVVPLVFFSVFCAVCSIDNLTRLGNLGVRSVVYFLATSFIAALLGLALVNIIRPGDGLTIVNINWLEIHANSEGLTLAYIIDSVLINPFAALAKGANSMLAIIVISTLFAVGIMKVKSSHKQTVIDIMNVLNESVMHITYMVLKIAPFGIWGLLLSVIYDHRQALGEFINSVSMFMFTSLLAMAIHGLIILPLILKIYSGRSIREFFIGIREIMQMAFATDSSIATIPVSLEYMQRNFNTTKKVNNFIMPLGATINMNASALYQVICAIFIAQALGVHLEVHQQIVVIFMAVLVSIIAVGIPSSALLILLVVTNSIGIENEKAIPFIGMIYAIDRFIDVCRTMVNVEGDCVGCLIIDEMEKKENNYEN